MLKQGEHVLPQAKEALQILTGSNPEGKHYPFIFVTNGGTSGPSRGRRRRELMDACSGGYIEADRAQRLTAELGVPVRSHHLIRDESDRSSRLQNTKSFNLTPSFKLSHSSTATSQS